MKSIKSFLNTPKTSTATAFHFNPVLKVVLATFIMGSSGVFIKYLQLPPIVLAFFRVAIPTILLFLYFRWQQVNVFRYPIRWMLLGSLLNAIRIYFYINSFVYTGLANAVIILYSWPVFTMIFSRLILGEKIPLRNAIILWLPVFGILLIFYNQPFSVENDDFIGMSSMLFSAIIYAFTVVIFKKESKHYSGFETVFFQNLVGSFVFFPFLFLTDFALTAINTGVLLLFTVSIGVIAFGLFFSALKSMKASIVSFLSYLEVLIATAYGIVLYGEKLSWNLIVGGCLIILSTLLLKKN